MVDIHLKFWQRAIWLTLFNLALALVAIPSVSSAWGRPVADDTLGSEGSRVTGSGGNFEIDRGARRGRNLFHSFREFDVDADGSVYFLNPSNVENIFSRITGSNPSNILGTLGVRGDANLFLMNPNGILFGTNARLDVQGSFVGTTANALQFGDRGFFSATNPEVPALLDVNPSAFLFNQVNAAPIISQSAVPNLTSPNFIDGLRVGDGSSLLLLAGEIQLQQAKLSAASGRIEIGAVSNGAVGLNTNGSNLDLTFPAELSLGNITLTGSLIDASGIQSSGTTGGEVQLTGNQIGLTNSSVGSANFGSQPNGSVFLTANQLALNNSSITTITAASGNGGDVQINADRVDLENRNGISTLSLGQGNAGNIDIRASDHVNISNGANVGSLVVRLPSASVLASGSPGNVNITTGNLNLQDASILVSNVLGQGAGGNITLQATDAVNLDESVIGTSSLGANASGNLLLNTRDLILTNGSSLLTSAADPINLNNLDPRLYSPSTLNFIRSLLVGVPPGAFGQGNSGDLTINATGAVRLSGGSTAATATIGRGQGGNLNVTANSINLAGTTANGERGSSLLSSTEGTGNAGNLSVSTRQLQVTGGALISSSALTNSTGRGGDLTISATDSIDLSGGAPNGRFSSGLTSETQGTGDAGNLSVATRQLRITDGALISTRTLGPVSGRGGDLTVNATDSINLSGTSADGQFSSGLFSATAGTGNAGNISVSTRQLQLTDGALISTGAVSNSTGRGGDLTVNATDSINLLGTSANQQTSSGLVSATSSAGRAGNISVATRQLRVADGAVISSNTLPNSTGGGGDLTVNASDSIELSGGAASGQFNSGLSSETQGAGDAGNLLVATRQLRVANGALISTRSFGLTSGRGGDMTVNATDSIDVAGISTDGRFSSGLFSATAGTGRAGDVRLQTGNLRLRGGGEVVASTFGTGRGGNIRIGADRIELSGTSPDGQLTSGIGSETRSTAADAGNAGNINITTNYLSVNNAAGISTGTFGQGNAGNIGLQVNGNTTLANRGFISSSVNAGAVGNSGNINLTTDLLSATAGGQITAVVGRQQNQQGLAGGRGNGGNIQITADEITLSGTDDRGFSSGVLALSERGANGTAGNIVMRVGNLRIVNGAIVVASTFNPGNGGNIEINAENLAAINGGQIVTSTRDRGRAGTITLNVSDRVLLSGVDPDFQIRREQAKAYAGRAGQSDQPSDVIISQGAASGLFVNTESNSSGDGGSLALNTSDLTITDRAIISAQSQGSGTAGNIDLNVAGELNAVNSDIITSAQATSGGAIAITGGDIRLRGDSDIRTQVASGRGGGGNITVNADSLVALDDSDIIAAAEDGQGGNIDFGETIAFFENFQPAAATADPDTLEANSSADINASGAAPGTIRFSDTSFIQNSLSDLPANAINTDTLLANSCIVRNQTNGTFVITGSDGLPESPGNASTSAYPTGTVRSVPDFVPGSVPASEDSHSQSRSWKIGDPIVEPQGVYQLPNGRLVISRECQ